jgi:hypothetical protein
MLGVDLLKRSDVKNAEGLDHLDTLSWLSRRFGAPIAPRTPSPLKPYPQFDTHSYKETVGHSQSYWATDQFTRLKQECGMENWSVQLQPESDETLTDLSEIPFNDETTSTEREAYKVDKYGRPVVTFDPETCLHGGLFAARVLTRLNAIRLLGYEPEEELSAKDRALHIIAGISFGGHGFALLPVADKLGEYLPKTKGKASLSAAEIKSHLIFNTCLSLACLNRTPEHIIASYGCVISPATRKAIKLTCEQLEEFEPEIKILKLRLTEMRRRAHLISMQNLTGTG